MTSEAPTQADLDAEYTAAREAFMDHTSGCYNCGRRGVDCPAANPLKKRLNLARSAATAATRSER